ncbi:MAG: ATP-binding protein [Thermoplasmatota archaeon]
MSVKRSRLVSNAGFLESVRHIGLTTVDAILELVDNSLDAGATKIHVGLRMHGSRMQIWVIDDGDGIPATLVDNDGDSIDGIAKALSFGGRMPGLPSQSIGRFGWGLSSAAACQSLRTAVYSRCAEEQFWRYSYVDFEELTVADTADLPDSVECSLPDWLEPLVESANGTIVVLEDCDNPDFKTVQRMTTELVKQLATVYRRYIHAGREIWVGKTKLVPRDPLYLMAGCHGSNEIPTPDIWDSFVVDLPVPGQTNKSAAVAVRIVNLDWKAIRKLDAWSPTWMNRMGLTEENQGFYLMRNERQIASAQTFGLFTRNADLNYFRAEISFPPELDRYFGVQTNKSRFSLKGELKDKLREKLGFTIGHIRKETRDGIDAMKAARRAAEQETSETPGERVARQSTSLLKKPTSMTATKAKQELEKLDQERQQEIKAIQENSELSTDKKRALTARAEAKFQVRALPFKVLFEILPNGHFYDPRFKGQQTQVLLNKGHAFFRLYERATQSQEQRILLDLLLQSAAHAERQFEGTPGVESALRTFRREWSTSLQVMLEKLDELNQD